MFAGPAICRLQINQKLHLNKFNQHYWLERKNNYLVLALQQKTVSEISLLESKVNCLYLNIFSSVQCVYKHLNKCFLVAQKAFNTQFD